MEAHFVLALADLSFLDNDGDSNTAVPRCWVSSNHGHNWQEETIDDAYCHFVNKSTSEVGVSLNEQKEEGSNRNAADSTPVGVTVLIPSHYVLSSCIEVPKKQQRHLETILPFLCEEKIANDLDDAHIATGAMGQPTNKVAVRIIDRRLLERLLSFFESHKIRVQKLFSQNDLISVSENKFFIDTEFASLRTINESITTDAANAVSVIDSWYNIQTSDQLESLELSSPLDELSTSMQLTIDQWRSQGASIIVELNSSNAPYSDGYWDRTRNNQETGFDLTASKGIDLLCGDFQPKAIHSKTSHWQSLVQVAGLLLALNLAYLYGSGLYWQSRAQTIHDNSRALYREYFPQDKRIINIKTQTLNHLNRQTDTVDAGALKLLTEFLPGWQAHKQSIRLKSLRYQQLRNELLLEVEATSIDHLDQLQQSLGDRAELLSANKDSDRGARGRLRFKGRSS